MGEPHPQLVDTAPPDMASFEECIKRETDDGSFPVGLMKNLTVRMHPDDSMFINGGHSGVALMRGWFEFKDLRPLDTLSLLLATDAMPPPVFNLPIASGWVPTLELTVHVRAVPVGTRLACVFRTRVLQGGLLEEDGELWDEAGNLVALSRQMAVAPRG